MKIAIIDYGAGNIENVFRAIETMSSNVTVITRPRDLQSHSHAIIPGVGAFDFGMSMLAERKFIDEIKHHVANEKPLLGICLGMHMLADLGHENGVNSGLGVIRATVKSLSTTGQTPSGEVIPHMGWQRTKPNNKKSGNFDSGNDYYFAHSYFFDVVDKEDVDSYFEWGEEKIPAVIQSENIIGVQFHPEKSGLSGLNLLKKFISI